ncbi:hypothetical protein K504DRAFT_463728 [Pleomassaria siparia CBS 279.74]|uniref:Uncharacterized protein n=1 Tax=Pleomassaria siparia CBS 279.74 TaxID=1314801 RepID=A0A6G1JRC7_9PLEO|nr:hypothetical protein K504DRAFT_463728 [Pleomassaria siparia CBS 279.74]
MVCGLFCVFWLSFGLLQLPTLGLATTYSVNGRNAVVALYLLVWCGVEWVTTKAYRGVKGYVTSASINRETTS